MRRKRIILKTVLVLVLSPGVLLAAGCLWYFRPVKAEDLNRLPCCWEGPLEATFKNGQIIAGSSPHPGTYVPGTVIGTYSVSGNTITLSMPKFSGTYELGPAGAIFPGGARGPDVPYAAWNYWKHRVEALVTGDEMERGYSKM